MTAITQTLATSLKPGPKPYEIRDTRLKGFLIRVQPTGVKTFYVQWARGKRAKLGLADALTAEQARALAKKVLAQAYDGKDPSEQKRAAKRAMTFGTFVTEHYAEHAKTLRTGTETCSRLQSVFPDLQGKQLSAITAWDVTKWRAKCAKDGAKPATIARNLAILRAALNLAVEWKLIAANPLDGVKGETVDNSRVRWLDDAERARLFAALDEREERIRRERNSANAWRLARGHDPLPDLRQVVFADYLKPMVLIALHTGIRRRELLTLSWGSVDLKGARLTVVAENAKTKRTRHISLSATALAAFEAWQEQTSGAGLVFPNDAGEPFKDVDTAWGNVIEAAKIEDFGWHDLRHCFASTLVQGGVSLVIVRELLGHSDFALTLRYAHLAPKQHAEAVAALDKQAGVLKLAAVR